MTCLRCSFASNWWLSVYNRVIWKWYLLFYYLLFISKLSVMSPPPTAQYLYHQICFIWVISPFIWLCITFKSWDSSFFVCVRIWSIFSLLGVYFHIHVHHISASVPSPQVITTCGPFIWEGGVHIIICKATIPADNGNNTLQYRVVL